MRRDLSSRHVVEHAKTGGAKAVAVAVSVVVLGEHHNVISNVHLPLEAIQDCWVPALKRGEPDLCVAVVE